MMQRCLKIFYVLAVCMALTSPALAQDISGRPKEQSGGSLIDLLGLTPKKQEPKPTPAPEPQSAPEPAPVPVAPAPTPAPATAPVVSAPPVSPPMSTAPPDENSDQGSSTADLDLGETTMIDTPDPFYANPQQADLPNKLTVVVNKWRWGTNDVQMLRKITGYGASDVNKNCRFSFNGSFMTATNFFIFDMQIKKAAVTGYSEPFQEISLMPVAICAAPQAMPPRAGFVIRYQNALVIPMGESILTCRFGKPVGVGNYTMTFDYQGDGQGQCRF